jgi:Flp pilus assembly pilin Flp
MQFLTAMYRKARQQLSGQTMTEYAFILAAVAIVVFVTYEVMGQDLNSMVNSVSSLLTAS